jgi:hypothetical protein
MNSLHNVSLAALLLASVCANAQVYECIDANGRKSYAQECPVNTVKAKEMHPDIVNPGAPVSSTDKLKALDDAYSKQRAAENAKAAEREQKAGDARANAQICADAKARLDALQSGRQTKRVDPVTGEHVPYDDDARQSQIAGLNQEIADTCK